MHQPEQLPTTILLTPLGPQTQSAYQPPEKCDCETCANQPMYEIRITLPIGENNDHEETLWFYCPFCAAHLLRRAASRIDELAMPQRPRHDAIG